MSTHPSSDDIRKGFLSQHQIVEVNGLLQEYVYLCAEKLTGFPGIPGGPGLPGRPSAPYEADHVG